MLDNELLMSQQPDKSNKAIIKGAASLHKIIDIDLNLIEQLII